MTSFIVSVISAACFFGLGLATAVYVIEHPKPPLYVPLLFVLFIACPCIFAGAAVAFNYYPAQTKGEPR